MKQTRWKQIDAVLDAALELAPQLRTEWLAQACAGDDELRQRVESLLRREPSLADFLEAPASRCLAELIAEETGTLTEGQQLERYRIEARLGAGGMGEVWRAWDERLNRWVALKLLPPEFAADAERVRRFEQEAYTISALKHPNIITIHDIGHVAEQLGGLHFIVTELVEGETLRAHLGTLGMHASLRAGFSEAGAQSKLSTQGCVRTQGGWRQVVLLATQVAEALHAAHTVGIIHRDIKPENIMVQADGHVKVLDFGIAKLVSRAAGGTEAESAIAGLQTKFGAQPGTLKYMSPEQARGEELDARTDIFSFGLVLYEMLAGRHPYDGKRADELIEALKSTDEIPPLTGLNAALPAALERIVTRTLGKRREERYESAGELLAALKELKSLIEVRQEERQERLLRTQNADQLLTRYTVFHEADRRAHIPLSRLWGVWRFASLKRGRLEREVLRSSLMSGLFGAG